MPGQQGQDTGLDWREIILLGTVFWETSDPLAKTPGDDVNLLLGRLQEAQEKLLKLPLTLQTEALLQPHSGIHLKRSGRRESS